MTIVLDTNAFVSAHLNRQGNEAQIMHLWRREQIAIALSSPLLNEYLRVLQYPRLQSYLQLSPSQLRKLAMDVKAAAVFVEGRTSVTVCRDPNDNMVFACALEAQADYIVSGDKDVLSVRNFYEIPTMTPKAFLEVYGQLRAAA